MLTNAKDKNLSQTTSGLPQVGIAVSRNLQQVVFEKMQTTMVNGRTQSVPIKSLVMASKQPLDPQRLKIKPTGDRAWSWYMIHTLSDLEVIVNDRIKFNGQGFKIMAKSNFKEYGYFYYEVIEDVIP